MLITKVTKYFNLLTSFDQALQGDVNRANDSPDGGILDQLWYRFLFFVFRLVFGRTRFDWRLRKISKTKKMQEVDLLNILKSPAGKWHKPN